MSPELHALAQSLGATLTEAGVPAIRGVPGGAEIIVGPYVLAILGRKPRQARAWRITFPEGHRAPQEGDLGPLRPNTRGEPLETPEDILEAPAPKVPPRPLPEPQSSGGRPPRPALPSGLSWG